MRKTAVNDIRNIFATSGPDDCLCFLITVGFHSEIVSFPTCDFTVLIKFKFSHKPCILTYYFNYILNPAIQY